MPLSTKAPPSPFGLYMPRKCGSAIPLSYNYPHVVWGPPILDGRVKDPPLSKPPCAKSTHRPPR